MKHIDKMLLVEIVYFSYTFVLISSVKFDVILKFNRVIKFNE